MIQEIFHIGSFSISPFGLMLVAAFFVAYWQLYRAMRTLEVGDEEDASALVFACGFIGILGGKVYYAVLMGDWHLLYDRAGIVWYGGFLGGLAAFLWTVRRRNLPMARTFDASAPGLALGYGVGRIGCFLVGDDYGIPSNLPWAMEFRVGLPPTRAGVLRQEFGVEIPPEVSDSAWVAVHPTQLYETAAGVLIWGLALWLISRRPKPGNVFLPVIAFLALERFLVEFVRAKDDRFFGDFTMAQLISLLILLTAAFFAWRNRGGESPPGGKEPRAA